VVVAVRAVRVVQVVADQEVDVVAVRDRLMAAAGAVDVIRRVVGACVARRAARRIRRVDRDRALVDMTAMWGVKMTVVKIVDVVAVLDRDVTAARAVDVVVLVVDGMLVHRLGSLTSSLDELIP
jgi:hypothetical protein